ncbi:Pre-mRNA-splicing factor ATP-dependent RNA helicase prp16 [Yarrowia sp. C11]|nr:Pre-mRNA-splicing factor ATP-dependent RNA helicase prp16 [Yarrowia sp. E02]KAG5372973.1 Pre-mRNA-splicing factor ATP-dependent RNA helicase prp16 [Yarrowia sp. C11]
METFKTNLSLRLSDELGKSANEKMTNIVLKLAETQPQDAFVSSCSAFGKFRPEFLLKIWSEVEELKKRPQVSVAPVASVNAPQPVKRARIELEAEEDDKTGQNRTSKLSSAAQKKLDEIRARRKVKGVSKRSKLQDGSDDVVEREIKRKETKPDVSQTIYNEDGSLREGTGGNKSDTRDKTRDRTGTKGQKGGTSSRSSTSSRHYNQEDLDVDREWYMNDEMGHQEDAWDDQVALEERTESKLKTVLSRRGNKMRENDLWEQNQMSGGGIVSGEAEQYDAMDEEDNAIYINVNNLIPPFLDGQQVFTRQKDPVSAVRDVQSDLAILAKRGSQLVKDKRQLRERQKQVKDASSTEGTVLGLVEEAEAKGEASADKNGVKNEVKDEVKEEVKKEGEVDTQVKLSPKEARTLLPAFAVRDPLLQVIQSNQVTIVIGETGSGKTTQLTQYLYEAGYAERGMIGCTQPRRVAAMSVAQRVSEEMEVTLGQQVGYAIRFEDHTSPATKIKYLTDGILLRETLTDPTLENYSCIIMDEAHERALNTDILLGLFRTILAKRRDLKLIVTSATMNSKRFSDFFGGAPTFTIPGRTYPVSVHHERAPVDDYVAAAVKKVLSIHVSSDVSTGDILVFMTGQEDITVTCEVLEERLKKDLDSPAPLMILPIFSQMPADLQNKIFNRAPPGVRKCIVATNIAETSLTVDGITFVVDAGYSKLKVYSPKTGMDSLQVAPISVAQAVQRSGRAGRTAKGTAYRLYTEHAEQEEMYATAIPEIQRTNLANTLLLLKSVGVSDLMKFAFMDPPPKDTIMASLYELWSLGAVDNLGNITKLGMDMSQFPMDPCLGKILLKSVDYGCSKEMLSVVAMLCVPSVFYRPPERQQEADSAREKFFVPESDHLTLLHVYTQWLHNKKSPVWCAKHFLHAKALEKAHEVREQLEQIMSSNKMPVESCGTDWDLLRKCICAGYFHQAARVHGLGSYRNLRTLVSTQLHPTSALYGLGYLPAFVIYHELILTSKEYMSCVTSVDPAWLAEFGSCFYVLKDRTGKVDFSRKRAGLERLLELDAKRREEKVEKKVEQKVEKKGPGMFRKRRGF